MPLSAPGFQFDHGGATYYVPRIIQGDRKRWQVWANARVLAETQANQQGVDAGWMSPGEFADLMESARRAIRSGKLHPQEQDGRELLATEDGYTAFVWIVMQRHDPRLTLVQITKLMADVGPKQFMEYWQLAQADPLPPAPPPGGENPATPPTSELGSPSAGDEPPTKSTP